MYSNHTLTLANEIYNNLPDEDLTNRLAHVSFLNFFFFGIQIGIPEGTKNISFLVRCGQVVIGRAQFGQN